MTPIPLIPISLVLSCGVAAIVGGLFGKSFGRGLLIALISAYTCAAVSPLIGVAILLREDWVDPIWCFKTILVIGGTTGAITLALAIPCAAIVGTVAAAVRFMIREKISWF